MRASRVDGSSLRFSDTARVDPPLRARTLVAPAGTGTVNPS